MEVSGLGAAALAALRLRQDSATTPNAARPPPDAPKPQGGRGENLAASRATGQPGVPQGASLPAPPPAAAPAANNAVAPAATSAADPPQGPQPGGLSDQMLSVLLDAQSTQASQQGGTWAVFVSSDVAAQLSDMLEGALQSYGATDAGNTSPENS